jgi:hypothetical protein
MENVAVLIWIGKILIGEIDFGRPMNKGDIFRYLNSKLSTWSIPLRSM